MMYIYNYKPVMQGQRPQETSFRDWAGWEAETVYQTKQAQDIWAIYVFLNNDDKICFITMQLVLHAIA